MFVRVFFNNAVILYSSTMIGAILMVCVLCPACSVSFSSFNPPGLVVSERPALWPALFDPTMRTTSMVAIWVRRPTLTRTSTTKRRRLAQSRRDTMWLFTIKALISRRRPTPRTGTPSPRRRRSNRSLLAMRFTSCQTLSGRRRSFSKSPRRRR